MKCLNTLKHIARNSFLLCILIGSPVIQAKSNDCHQVDKILKKDLDTIFDEMQKQIAANEHAHFATVRKKIIDARNDFFNYANNDGIDKHVIIMESNLMLWYCEVVNNNAYAGVKEISHKLYEKLAGSLEVFKEFIQEKGGLLNLVKLGVKLDKYSSMLPKHLNHKDKLLKLMKKRLDCNAA